MTLPTCAVVVRVYKQDGTPDAGAVITATLNRFDVDSGEGYVGPIVMRAVTDASGSATLDLWPNELGSTRSGYTFLIVGQDRVTEVVAYVPANVQTVDLEDIATLPPYPGKPDGYVSVVQARAAAAEAAASAAAAAQSAAGFGEFTDALAAPSGSALVGFTQNLSGAISQTTQEKNYQIISPEDVGADSEALDNTAAFAKLQNFSGTIDGQGRTYLVGAIEFAGCVQLKLNFKAAAGFSGQELITISGDDSSVNLTVDASSLGITAAVVSGNRISGTIVASNITGISQGAGGTQSGVHLTGQYCDILAVGRNHLKGTSDNDSVPRVASVDLGGAGTGNNNTIRVVGNNVNAGLVTGQAQCYAPSILIDGLTDNGIYQIQGALNCGTVTLKNALDETVVSEGVMHIDTLTLIDCSGSGGLQNGDITIGAMVIQSSNPARSSVPFRTRSGNSSSNLRIGSLTGEIYLAQVAAGAGIFQFQTGLLASFIVGAVDLKVHYVAGSTKVLMNHDTGSKVVIENLQIELIDDTGTLSNTDKFNFNFPSSLALQSYLGPVRNISSSGEIRVVNAIQPTIELQPLLEISDTIGPYILQANASFPKPNWYISTAVPTVGTFNKGDIISVKLPSFGGTTEYVCTTAGSPGVWRSTKWEVGRGTTSARPVLTANDSGVTYLDTTLATAGKPVTWTGTAWVDQTGTVV